MLTTSRRLIQTTVRDLRVGSSLLGGPRSYHESIINNYENPRNVGNLDKNKANVGTCRLAIRTTDTKENNLMSVALDDASNQSRQSMSNSPATIDADFKALSPQERDEPAVMSEEGINIFLSSLPFASMTERQEFLQWTDEFPLVIQSLALEKAMVAWLSRLTPTVSVSPTKENQPLVMTSAPTGSGKTIFLLLLCQLFRHQWDVDRFITSLCCDEDVGIDDEVADGDDTMKLKAKVAWINSVHQALENIKKAKGIKEVIASGTLAKSFLTSTHPCFVSFNSTTPITEEEIRLLGHSPEHMLIARIIFSELKPPDGSFEAWPIRYNKFLNWHLNNLLRLPLSLHHVVDFIRKKFGCEHFLLAIDELVFLDRDVTTSAASASSHFNCGVRRVLTAVGQVIMTDPRCAAIVSSLVTGPLSEYVLGSQHEPVFIPLHPFLDNLAHIADIIVERRRAPETFHNIMRMLLSTGGHPKLLYKMIPWLSDRFLSCGEMTLAAASEICCIGNNPSLHDADIARAILVGCPVPADMVAFLSGLGGMLTRPTSLIIPSVVIVSPLVLYVVASRHPALRSDSTGIERALTVDALVPSEIRSGEVFEHFVATWLTFRLRLGESLGGLLVDQGNNNVSCGDNVLREYLKMRKIDSIHEFYNWPAFVESLPSVEAGMKFTLDVAQRTAKGEAKLFGMDRGMRGGLPPTMRVSVPLSTANPGFDIVVGRGGQVGAGDEKRVLLVHCKAHVVNTIEAGGQGQRFSSGDLADTIRRSAVCAGALYKNGFKVSLLVITACQTASTVVSNCPISNDEDSSEAISLFEHTGVIGKAALRNLLGANFALALELAQGHVYRGK